MLDDCKRHSSLGFVLLISLSVCSPASAQQDRTRKRGQQVSLSFPPRLADGRSVVTDRVDSFLQAPDTMRDGVVIASVPPTIDFAYYPGQSYAGKPWSAWGDSLARNGKYYASIGDHLAPRGKPYVYEYDPEHRQFRLLADVAELLNLPPTHYVPGKIHGRLDIGSDGWLYFATHRGSSRVTTDEYHFRGDWILRSHPDTGQTEIVAHAPVPKHCIPSSVLDPERMIFYGSTAAGSDAELQGIQFFAYDIDANKLLYSEPGGPSRAMAFAKSTGRIYYVPGRGDAPLMRFDPRIGRSTPLAGRIGIRAATEETPQGMIYTVSLGQGGSEPILYALDAKTERIEELGPAAVGSQTYIATIDADPTGRFLYYVPGAHGGSDQDGSAVVQFDTHSRRKKVIAFLADHYRREHGCTPKGTYSLAVDPSGDKLYITWNVSRGGRSWDCCALSVIRIPAAERR